MSDRAITGPVTNWLVILTAQTFGRPTTLKGVFPFPAGAKRGEVFEWALREVRFLKDSDILFYSAEPDEVTA